MTTRRGLRINNPGNLRLTTDDRKGMVKPADSRHMGDREFCQFENPQMGIRAVAKVLRSYQVRHGLRTVRQIVARYAPSAENDTDAYVRDVAARLDVSPDQDLTLAHPDTMRALVKAIIHHEQGEQPYNDAIIAHGVDMAMEA